MAFIRERDGKFSVVYKVKDDKGKVHQKSETFRKNTRWILVHLKLKNVPQSRNCWRST